MKPHVIFGAVLAVCLLLGISLPHLSNTPSAAAAGIQAAESSPHAPDDAPEAVPAAASDLDQFTKQLINNQPDQLAGIFAGGIFALPVREQPAGNENYVSSEDNTVTLYATPAQFGVTGLLAHNYLSGRTFFLLQPGDEITAVYGDGQQIRYRVSELKRYQALSPHDPMSSFVDLDGSGEIYNYQQVFQQVYTKPNTLVLQTCIEQDGELSWGRLFVIAERL